jgi:hypothetical protein
MIVVRFHKELVANLQPAMAIISLAELKTALEAATDQRTRAFETICLSNLEFCSSAMSFP